MDERILKYFNDELTSGERILLLQEIERDEVLKKQFAEYQNLYALLNLSPQIKNSEIGKQKYIGFVRRKQKIMLQKRWLQWIGYAAAIFLITATPSLLTVWQTRRDAGENIMTSQINTLYTPAGQRARLVLQDGTEVWLNAKSRLMYPARFTGTERRVAVEGEAFFNVAKDSTKPFIVSASGVDMKVLGTQFNVYCYPESGYIQTSLLEGSVRVFFQNREDKGVVLKPNQQVTIAQGRMQVEAITQNEHFLWRDGIYAFDNEPLIHILKKLELYYDVKIIIEDTSLFRDTYTGKFRQRDSIDDIFRILQQIRNFKVQKDTEKNIITLSK